MPDAAAGAQGFEILPRPADLLVLREPLELQSLEMGHGGLGLLFSFSTHLLSIASRRPWGWLLAITDAEWPQAIFVCQGAQPERPNLKASRQVRSKFSRRKPDILIDP